MSPSLWQILIVVGIIVLLFGAKRLPDLGKSFGQAIRGFKEGVSEDALDVTESSKNEQISENNQNQSEQKQKETEKQES
ncbi:MAG: twin-arginine translocase TatA/TatE family subunit [Bdellovibrionales bacterium]